MSDTTDMISVLERYLLAPDKEVFFSSLVKGSDLYERMRVIDHLNRYGLKMPADSRASLERILDSSEARRSALASFKTQLLQIAADEDTATRAKRMKKFNEDFLGCSFNHPQPANVDQSGRKGFGASGESLPNTWDAMGDLSLDKVVESMHSKASSILLADCLRTQYYHHLDLNTVMKQAELRPVQAVLSSLRSFTHIRNLPEVLEQYGALSHTVHKTAGATASLLDESMYARMTLAQLMEVSKVVSGAAGDFQLLAAAFVKTFEADLDVTDRIEEPAERRAVLVRMLAWADAMPTCVPMTALRTQLVREMVETDLEVNHVDEALVMRYLANPLSYERGVYPTLPEDKEPIRTMSEWYPIHRFPRSRWHKSERALVTACLQRLLADPASAARMLPQLSPWLHKDFLNEAYCRVRLLSGADATDAPHVLGEAQLTALREERRLAFVPWNRRRYKPGDSVSLLLEVKNVPTVSVSIFEMDTESYYRNHTDPIDPRVNLSGLVPSKRLEHTLTDPPVVSRVVEFKDLLAARRGVYVVEFVGGGLSSRAVVHVGGLTVVRQVISKGVLLTIVDEEGRVCADDSTGLHVDGRVLRPQEALRGAILVPCATEPRQERAVLTHAGYAELYRVDVPGENVDFNVGLVVNEESVVVGGSVRLLLLPQVSANGRRVGLMSLRKVCVTVTSINDDDVANVTSFDNLKFDARGKALALDYMVPPQTRRVMVRTTAEFYSSAQEKYIELASERTIGINGMRGQPVYYDYYVTPDAAAEDDLVAMLLGKNGEPYAKQRVEVRVNPVYRQSFDPMTIETDEAGRVRLQNIRRCASEVTIQSIDAPGQGRVHATYTTSSHPNLDTLPRAYDVVEGEELVLPLGSRDGAFHAGHYELVRVTRTRGDSIIDDLSATLAGRDGTLSVSGLTEGRYRLRYLEAPGDVTVYVTVLRGQRWAAAPQKYLLTPRGIHPLVNQGLMLSMYSYRLDASSGAAQVRVSARDLAATEVHVYAFTHFPRTLDKLYQQLQGTMEWQDNQEFPLRPPRVGFLSGKRLGDEITYVLERKRRRPYMGSTLEKPPGLLQRHFVRETAEDDEELEGEEDYAEVVEEAKLQVEMAPAAAPPAPVNAAPRMKMMMRSAPMAAVSRGRAGRHGGPEGFLGGGMGYAAQTVEPSDYPVTRLNTFLASAGWCATNLTPAAESGVASFTVPLDAGYSTLVVIACDSRGAVVLETHAVPVKAQPRVDVRLSESKNASRVYVQERIAQGLRAGERYEAKDASSTSLRIIDDVPTTLKVLRALSTNSGLDEWAFLSQWASLPPRERLRKYNKYMSHEFNVFAYFKDSEFFEAVVRPHLVSKTRKGVVDLFLLGDTAALGKYLADPAQVNDLDVLERTLLVAALAGTHPTACAAIARAAREAVGPDSERDPRQYERLFDSVINGKEPTEEETQSVAQQAMAKGGMPKRFAACAMPGMARCADAAYDCPQQDEGAYGLTSACNLACTEREDEYEDAFDADEAVDGRPAMEIRKYRVVDTTNEYAEKQYYAGSELNATLNYFWCDALEHYAQHGVQCGAAPPVPLMTASFIYATGSTAEMILAAALTGVSTEKPVHTTETAGQALRVTMGGSGVLFSREIREKEETTVDLDILVMQRMCDPQDMYKVVSGTRTLKPVVEYLVGKIYVSRVVVTNATESELKLSLVTEVPQGSVPVIEPEYSDNKQLVIGPLSTRTVEFHFYFPSAGDFTCFPASVNKDGQLVAAAKPLGPLHVVRARTITQLDTISDILNQGSKADILAFMERENLHKREVFTFESIYWLLRDGDFYASVIALLRRKCHFDETIWSYSVLHADREAFREYLESRYRKRTLRLTVLSGRESQAIEFLASGLLRIDSFAYLEYNPLVNTRAHIVGRSGHSIRNRQFRETYEAFLRYLFLKTPAVRTRDYVYWCTYLLLQDRVEDALHVYTEHIATAVAGDRDAAYELRLQRDYLAAYLSLYTDKAPFTKARDIARRYLTYPVYTWRNRFIEVINLIAETEAAPVAKAGGIDAVTGADRNAAQAMAEPYMDCELDGQSVRVRVGNIASFTVRFYRVDLEVLFSQNPFLDVEDTDYGYVTANHTLTVRVSSPSPQAVVEKVPIPAELADANLIIHVGHGAIVKSLAYFPKTMEVRVNRNFGQLRVVDAASGSPQPLVYVKAFARRGTGEVGFFKDGYTDAAGGFEYASVHGGTDKLNGVEEFSLLVLSESCGASLERVKPPSRAAEVAIGASQVRSAELQKLQEHLAGESSSKYWV